MSTNIDLNNLPEVRLQDADGVWHLCKPFVVPVSGGKRVVYTTKDGRELKQETLSRYKWRINRRKVKEK